MPLGANSSCAVLRLTCRDLLRPSDDPTCMPQAALRLQPHQPGTCNNLGAALMARGQPWQAVQCYAAALSMDPSMVGWGSGTTWNPA